jgi:hypothetical protein
VTAGNLCKPINPMSVSGVFAFYFTGNDVKCSEFGTMPTASGI